MGKALETVEPLLPLVTIDALTKLEYDPESAAVGLLSNSFFGNNILIDNMGHVRVLDWERGGIGDLAQDFFPLKYWTVVDKRSGWYLPDTSLFAAFCVADMAVSRGTMAASTPGRRLSPLEAGRAA
jgi:aminoglycoside phosphotransferase (APT) family kinase protein